MKPGGVLAAVIGLASVMGVGLPLSAANLRVSGSDLLGTEFTDSVQAFAKRSERPFELSLDGSRSALARLQAGGADVGLIVVRPGRQLPLERFASFPVAYHVVFVLAPANLPLQQIAVPDLAAIYGAAAGASHARWGELGLTGEWGIRAIDAEAMATGQGLSLEIFRDLVLGGGELKSVVTLQPSEDALIRKLLTSDTGIALASEAPAANVAVKVLPVAVTPRDIAYAPTPEHVHAGDYALRLPVWIVVRREAARDNLDFLQFLLSDEVARALEHAGLVALPPRVREELKFAFERL